MADRKLTVQIVGDSSSLERAFRRSKTAAGSFEGAMRKASRAAAFAAVGIGVGFAVAASKAVRAASDLNEQMNKSAVVFGSSAADVQAWSKTSATAFGVSQRAALEAAGGFGQMFETAGLTEGVAADFSKTLVGLAADMASFNNIDPAEALLKLKSGLAGEAEPLRTVGVLLSEARVKTEAYRSGLAKQGAVLTEAQKVQARYNLILQDTAKQQGDFSRTSSGLANSTRIIKAELENASASLGSIFLPVVAKAASGLARFLGEFQKAKGLRAKFNVAVTGLENLGRDLFEAIKGQLDGINFSAAIRGAQDAGFNAIRSLAGVLGRVDFRAVGREIGGALSAAFGNAAAFLQSVDFEAVGQAIVNGIGNFLRGVNWGELARATIRLLIASYNALTDLLLGIGETLGRALLRGVSKGLSALGGFLEEQALKIILKVVKALDFTIVGRHVIPGLNSLIKSIQAKIDSLHGKNIVITVSTKAVGGIAGRRNFDPSTTPTEPPRTPTVVTTPTTAPTATGPTAAERAAKALEAAIGRLNLAVAKAGLTKTLKDDLAANARLVAFLKKQVALHKNDLDLANQLVSAEKDRNGLLEQRNADAKERNAAAVAARNARQFRTLGLGPTGDALTPLKTGLARQLKQVTASVAGTFLDTDKTKKVLAAIRKLVLNPFTKVSADVRATIKGMLDDITKQLKDHQQGPLTKTQSLASAGNLFGGLGLDRATQKRLQARLTGFNSAGVRLAGVSGGGFNVVVHHETKLDGRVIEHSTTKHQQRRVRQNPSTRRGRR